MIPVFFTRFFLLIACLWPCALAKAYAGEAEVSESTQATSQTSPHTMLGNNALDFLSTQESTAPLLLDSPEEILERLEATTSDWMEPSLRSEVHYVLAIRKWLASLPPGKQSKARRILREAHPGLRNLRAAIREKKLQLSSLSFDRDTGPETLPRLGQELQQLRSELKRQLVNVSERVRKELGINLEPDGEIWLALPENQLPGKGAPQISGSAPQTSPKQTANKAAK